MSDKEQARWTSFDRFELTQDEEITVRYKSSLCQFEKVIRNYDGWRMFIEKVWNEILPSITAMTTTRKTIWIQLNTLRNCTDLIGIELFFVEVRKLGNIEQINAKALIQWADELVLTMGCETEHAHGLLWKGNALFRQWFL